MSECADFRALTTEGVPRVDRGSLGARRAKFAHGQFRSALCHVALSAEGVALKITRLLPGIGVPSQRPRPARDGCAVLASRASVVAQ